MSERNGSKSDSKQAAEGVLVVDVGGTHVKILATGQKEKREFDSGPHLTARGMVSGVKHLAKGWRYGVVSIGYPGPVIHGHPFQEPHNLGHGWVGFDYRRAFGCPVKIVNDAAMQAMGSYRKGRMLFLGLGTGLGTAMIIDGAVQPMEIAHLPFRKGKTYEDYLGIRGLKRLGRKKWRKWVLRVATQFQAALEANEVVIGGGNAKKLKDLPKHMRLGENSNAFIGGFRLWQEDGAKKGAHSGSQRGARRGSRPGSLRYRRAPAAQIAASHSS